MPFGIISDKLESIKNNKIFSKISKPVWNILGSFFVGLGVIGIFIPLLPTTPFLLLAAFSFNRGSEKMRKWFKKNKLIGSYINNYNDKKGIPLRSKMNSIFILWFTIGVSLYFVTNIYVRIVLLLVIVGVTTHLLMIPTLKGK